MNKKDYWDAVFDDSMDLIARLPRVAAYIYRRKYKNGDHIQPNGLLDWAGNFAHMMGYEDESFKELMRLYMTIHADHEGGNVSAHATHLVGSALSDPYLSFAAGMNGLAKRFQSVKSLASYEQDEVPKLKRLERTVENDPITLKPVESLLCSIVTGKERRTSHG